LPLDSRARRLLNLIEAASPGRDDGVAGLRRATEALADFANPPPDVERRDLELHLPARRLSARAYAPTRAGETRLPGLVYFHGGGLVSGSLASHDAIAAELADAARCRVIALDYRLAPEHRFPAAHDDAFEALGAIASAADDFGLDRARLGIGGDSAGGGLAVAAALRARIPLKLLFLLCPVLDPLAREPSRSELSRGYLIEEATMERYWALYCAEGQSNDDPRVAPLRAGDFASLPPTRVHTAEFDPLKDEGSALVRAVRAAGGEASSTEHAGLIHHFYGLTAVIPAAKAALARIGADLGEGLNLPFSRER
jgi:acetyl esterase